MTPVKQAAAQPSPEEAESMLSFVPAGIPRSIAEYIIALIPGAILMFVFFIASEAVVLFIDQNLAITFLPVICIVPLLAGAVATLLLEKVRRKPLSFKRGALVGAIAGFTGALLSALLLVVINLLAHKEPFGTLVSGPLTYVLLLVILGMDTLLAALGGVIVVKLVRDV